MFVTQSIALKSETAKMIYADPKVANMLKGKIAKRHPDKQWEVAKVATGWQVRKVEPLAVEPPQSAPAPAAAKQSAKPAASHVTISAKLQKETGSWLYFAEPVGDNVLWVHKNHVTAWKLQGDTVELSMSTALAVKKKIIA